MEKKEQPLQDSTSQDPRYRRLRAQLLAADALFEAARAGERGEPFARVLEAWMEWFMSEKRLNGEAAGQAHRAG
jgi:hypothetical protein